MLSWWNWAAASVAEARLRASSSVQFDLFVASTHATADSTSKRPSTFSKVEGARRAAAHLGLDDQDAVVLCHLGLQRERRLLAGTFRRRVC